MLIETKKKKYEREIFQPFFSAAYLQQSYSWMFTYRTLIWWVNPCEESSRGIIFRLFSFPLSAMIKYEKMIYFNVNNMNFNKLIWLIKKYVKLIPKGQQQQHQRLRRQIAAMINTTNENEILLWFWAKILITKSFQSFKSSNGLRKLLISA